MVTSTKLKKKKAVRYICNNTAGLSYLLFLINGKLVSKPKYEQLLKHNYGTDFNCTILAPSHKVVLDNHWLAGDASQPRLMVAFILVLQGAKRIKQDLVLD